MLPWILGISASHNGAYCLLHGDEIRVAIQEERLVGAKRARLYGARSGLGLRYCLDTAGISLSDLSMVVISVQGRARDARDDIRLNPDLRSVPAMSRRLVSHHLAHAASTLATSGYPSAAILVADGLGSPLEDATEAARRVAVGADVDGWEHLSLYRAKGTSIEALETNTVPEARWVHKDPDGMWGFFTLGGMYSAVAQQIFGDPMHAGKVMGLAPFGTPRIPVAEFLRFDGARLRFTNLVQERFRHVERWPARRDDYRDLAASVQRALEHALLRIVRRLRALTGETRLCYAGGVALNSVANEMLLQEGGFEQVHVVPAAEDSGVALGAAYLGLWELGGSRPSTRIRTDAHGRAYMKREIKGAFAALPDVVAARPADLHGEVVERLRRGEIGAWFQGRAEFGPRALGQRSILCSPCGESAKDELNARVKFREAFRPFAPAVLAEHSQEWFDFGGSSDSSPFMLRVVPVHPHRRKEVPAVVHVDGTGRLQTVDAEHNGEFHRLISRFHARTGIPILLNTSLNVRGEPIAEAPIDALFCLIGTGLDFCVIHDWIATKRDASVSVLDYVPRIAAQELALRLQVEDGAIQSSLTLEDAVTMRVSTRWGRVDTTVPRRTFPLLSRIDGERDGHALAAAVCDLASPREVATALLLLRRMHVLELWRRGDDAARD